MSEIKNINIKELGIDETLINQLYNKEVKLTYLRDCIEDIDTRVSYCVYLIQTAVMENRLGKDLYEFSREDILDLFSSNYTSSHTALRTFYSVGKSYSKWATSRGFNKTQINSFDLVKFKEHILPMLNVKGLTKEIIDEEQLWTIIDLLKGKKNNQDLVCAMLPFYGVRGNKNEDIINLKKNDIDEEGNKIKVRNIDDEGNELVREVLLPERAMNLLIEAANETTYKKPGKNTDVDYPLVDSSFIIRPLDSSKSKSSEFMTSTGIAARTKKMFVAFAEELKEEKNVVIREIFKNVNVEKISINNVYNSGKIHVLKQIESEKGAELDFNDYKEVNRLFGSSDTNYDNIKVLYEIYIGKK